MSMHKEPLTELEKEGLQKHHLPTDRPSQLSDCFRLGMRWAELSETEEGKVMNEEKIYKLIDKDGYLDCNKVNLDILSNHKIARQGCIYYKGYLDDDGDFMSSDQTTVLIDSRGGEFKYFEEVDSLPRQEDSTFIQQPLSERVYQFAKEHKLYSSYDGEKDYFVVLILDIDYKISTIEDLDKLDEMYKLHRELMI